MREELEEKVKRLQEDRHTVALTSSLWVERNLKRSNCSQRKVRKALGGGHRHRRNITSSSKGDGHLHELLALFSCFYTLATKSKSFSAKLFGQDPMPRTARICNAYPTLVQGRQNVLCSGASKTQMERLFNRTPKSDITAALTRVVTKRHYALL